MGPGKPERGLQIAQSTRTLLDVRLEESDRTPVALVKGTQVGKDVLDEPAVRGAFRSRLQAVPEDLRQTAVPAYEAAFQDRGPGITRVSVQRENLVQCPNAVPDIKPRIPENVEEDFRRPPRIAERIARRPEHHQIDIGVRTEFRPAVASERQDRQVFLPPGVEPGERFPDGVIHHLRERRTRFKRVGTRPMARGNLSGSLGEAPAKLYGGGKHTVVR